LTANPGRAINLASTDPSPAGDGWSKIGTVYTITGGTVNAGSHAVGAGTGIGGASEAMAA